MSTPERHRTPSPSEPGPRPRPHEADDPREPSAAGSDEPWRPRLVTVVVPMRNAAGTIAGQLEALAAQDYDGAWELIVADNGSTDGSPEIVRSWGDRPPHPRLVDASGVRGSAHARNVGTRAGCGELVLYADADDLVAPGWVSAMVEAAGHGDLLAGWDEGPAGDGAPTAGGARQVAFLPWARGGNLGVRREAFEEVGGWDEQRLRGQDVDFCWRVQLAGHPLVDVPQAVARYRRPESLGGLARHQFEFGARAPALFEDFRANGAVQSVPSRTLRRIVWLTTRSPYLLLSPRLRRRWVLVAAGALGRGWGRLLLILRGKG